MQELVIPGQPTSKGRPRLSLNGHAYTPQKTRDAEAAVQLAARKAGVVKADGPLLVEMNFCFQIPRSWSKRDQALAREMQVMPCSKPDIDNCIKLVLDALNGIGWHDDKQIIGIVARKFYSV